MKRFLFGALITLAFVFVFRSCQQEKDSKTILQENSLLLQKEIENVSKLIVTEGHFAEVYNYKDSQQLFGPLITAHKKALVVVNAEVTVAYDLAQLQVEVDESNKTLRIKSIPEPEVKIYPDFEYYDVTADYLNRFDAKDYNLIKKNVRASLMKKIKASSLVGNAQNRLLSELAKFYVLTNSMDWTLVYEGRPVDNLQEIQLPAIKD